MALIYKQLYITADESCTHKCSEQISEQFGSGVGSRVKLVSTWLLLTLLYYLLEASKRLYGELLY